MPLEHPNDPLARPFGIEESARHLFDFFGLRLRFPFLGLAFAHCWLYCMPRIISTGSPYFSPLLYLGLSSAMLACALLAWLKGANASSRVGVASAGALLGVAGTFVLTSGVLPVAQGPLAVLLTLTCGCSVGCTYLGWGAFYRGLGLRQGVLVLFLTMALGSLLKIPFEMLDPGLPTAILFSTLPAASFVSWLLSMRRLPALPQQPSHVVARKRLPLGFYACGVAMFGIAIGINRSLSTGFFDATAATAVSHLIEVTLAASVIALVYRQQIEFDFSQLWMLILVVIATGLVIGRLSLPGAKPVSIATLSSGHLLLVIFYWLSLCDLAHRFKVPSDVVFGLGWPTYALPMAIASGVAVCVESLNGDVPLFVVYALLLSVFFFMSKHRQSDEALFADLSLAAGPSGESLETRVHKLAQEHDFSPRETEVALLYAQGRSRSFISAELVLSENTVRDHIAGIYRKLGVHNKQEYIDLLQQRAGAGR